MPDNSRVMQLLELALDSGSTPEAVCADDPELLPQVREQWENCRRIEAHIDDLFPSSHAPTSEASARSSHEPTNLPDIPGYQVQSILGRGGMGIVYKAHQLRLNRTIALKMLLSGAYASRVERARFLREAQAIAGLRHAHIVQVHDAGEFEGRPYFTMEFVEGTNLAVKLAGVPQPARKAAAMLELLANAIESAHENGIIHRDLKPANILLATDGTPKIGDFGLARHFEGEDTLTVSGARVGTPSYMAPEQVDNRTGAVGPGADVYALGAILYEMLTGRPPFRGESAAETERQLIAQDPVPPSKLNARVPRDLETICLKCLQKEPRRRYTTAGDLAADLGRYQRGEPVSARRITVLERAIKWARRRPALATAITASLIGITALTAGSFKVVSDRAANTKTIEEDLRDVTSLQQKSSWSQAEAALERTKAHLEGHSISLDLHRRFDQAQADSKLAAELQAIRQDHAGGTGSVLNFDKSDKAYAAAFATAGLGTIADDPSLVAARIKASSICPALIEALNDWSFCLNPRQESDWILAVVRQADDDATGWRTAIRDPKVWNNGVVLEQSISHISIAEEPVDFLLAVAHQLQGKGRESLPFLTQIQLAHSGDLWANLELAKELFAKQNWIDAMRFYQAALALQPGQSYVMDSIGRCLGHLSRPEDAMQQYRLAIQTDPGAFPPLANLATQLMILNRPAEAIPYLRKGAVLNPTEPMFFVDLGECMDLTGHTDEAIVGFQHALKLEDLKHPLYGVRTKLRIDLMKETRLTQARKVWADAIRLEPQDHMVWDGYAECCLYLGDEKEYRNNCAALIDRFENETYSRYCEQTGRACLMLPPSPQLLRRATAMIDRALISPTEDDATYKPYFEVAKGLALYRAGQYDDSLKLLNGRAAAVLGPMPGLICAMDCYRKGDLASARTMLARVATVYDWRPSQASSRESWLYHILRREAESLIIPRAGDFLRGAYQPTTIEERLSLVATCQSKNLLGAGANLWADIFQNDPNVGLGNRSAAYAMAAFAGSGEGDDAAKFTDKDRRRWRQLARQWLLADIAYFEADLAKNSGSKSAMRFAMDNALVLPDLAGIRDADKLSALSAAEQRECNALWDKVRALRDRLPATN